ncbi:MAG: 16S rRNA (guanine(527)-N(7))-methyltransferase RsmG [Pelovirga sp.]
MKNQLKQGADILGINGMNVELTDRLLLYAEELLRWNTRINLTSIRELEGVIEKHILDSLMVGKLLDKPSRILDMGSGGGVPVIPLALALPDQSFFSVDSVGKKINFQQHIKRLLGLKNLQIRCARIEELNDMVPVWNGFDVVLARALGHTNDLLKMALPLIGPAGIMVAMKGPEGEGELASIQGQWHRFYEIPERVVTYQLPFTGASRCLISIRRKKG